MPYKANKSNISPLSNGQECQAELLRQREAGILPWPCFSCQETGEIRLSTVRNRLRRIKTPCARCGGKGHYYEKRVVI